MEDYVQEDGEEESERSREEQSNKSEAEEGQQEGEEEGGSACGMQQEHTSTLAHMKPMYRLWVGERHRGRRKQTEDKQGAEDEEEGWVTNAGCHR